MEVSEAEIERALVLMETMSRDDPEFRDEYTEAMGKSVEAKRASREPPDVPAPGKPAEVLHLMARPERIRAAGQGLTRRGRRRARDAAGQECRREEAGRGARTERQVRAYGGG
ncbi:hypothetical protein [Streptomyces sp. NPDC088812]|uniref:hypothetical protein n=1 Tax=Streptomyces sp. NPDC088812 TaxID=3365905 RepID=UPI00381586B5